MKIVLLFILIHQLLYPINRSEIKDMVKALKETREEKKTLFTKNVQSPFAEEKQRINKSLEEVSPKKINSEGKSKENREKVSQKLFDIPRKNKAIELQAIINEQACINKKWLSKGDNILYYKVTEIGEKHVVLHRGSEETILRISPQKEIIGAQ